MISKKKIKQIEQYLNIQNEKKAFNDVKMSILKECIEAYNIASKDIEENGYIVESYKQKYLNPSYKIKVQSTKEIIKILASLIEENKREIEDKEASDFIKSLIE